MGKLLVACESGDIETAKMLIFDGANVNEKNNTGCTPLNYICMYGRCENVELLESQGVACLSEYYKLAALLISHGANVNNKDNHGNTPLHHACGLGFYITAELLTSHGANLDETNNNGDTPLHLACCNMHYEIAKLLITYRANVDVQNNNGDTPLHLVCREMHYEMVKLLTHHNANTNVKDNHGNTPLHITCHKGNFDMAKLLFINIEANINVKNDNKETPIMIARQNKHAYIVILLEKELKKRIYILSLIINNDVLKHYIIRKID